MPKKTHKDPANNPSELQAWQQTWSIANPHEQYAEIMEWLYQNDRAANSAKEWRTDFIEMLRKVLKIFKTPEL